MENKAKEAVKVFMEAWKKGDHKAMLEACNHTYRVANTFQNVRAALPGSIKSYEITGVEQVSEVMYDVQVKVTVSGRRKQPVSARVICETAPFKPSTYGNFGVNPLSIRKGLG